MVIRFNSANFKILFEGESDNVFKGAIEDRFDLAVGKVLTALEEAGLADDTIVIFISDHGDYLGDHGMIRKGTGASHSLLHLPLIMRAPKADLPGRVDAAVSNCDIMPTLTSLAGVNTPVSQDGSNLCETIRSDDDTHALVFSTWGDRRSVNYFVYDARHRLTYYPGLEYVELFDHEADPGECRNVACEVAYTDMRNKLMSVLTDGLAKSYNPILGRVSAW